MPCKLVEFEVVTDAGGPILPHRSIPDTPANIPDEHGKSSHTKPSPSTVL